MENETLPAGLNTIPRMKVAIAAMIIRKLAPNYKECITGFRATAIKMIAEKTGNTERQAIGLYTVGLKQVRKEYPEAVAMIPIKSCGRKRKIDLTSAFSPDADPIIENGELEQCPASPKVFTSLPQIPEVEDDDTWSEINRMKEDNKWVSEP